MKTLLTVTSLLSLSTIGLAQYPPPPSGGFDAYAYAREFNRQQAAMLQQREQIQRDNIREMNRAYSGSGYSTYPSGYSSYPSGYSGGYSSSPIPSGYSSYPSGYSGGYSSSPFPSGYSSYPSYPSQGILIEGGSLQRSSSKVVASAPSGVQKFSARGISAVDGHRTPKDATEFYHINGTTYFVVPGSAAPEVIAAAPSRPAPARPEVVVRPEPVARVVPKPVEVKKPEDYLPKERFAQISSRFTQAGVGFHAYLTLVDEPIGPQVVGAPVVELPEVAESTLTALKKDRLTVVQGLFDQATIPDLKAYSKNALWTGHCVFRSSPTVETGAVIGFIADGNNVRAVVVTAATPRQVADSAINADPKKYNKLTAAHSEEIQRRLNATKNEVSGITYSPLGDRPLTRDSLFFDADAQGDTNQGIGYRLRTFTTLTKKTVLVAEGYVTTKPGASFVGKRVDYLEPVQFCYFNQSWSF